MKLFFVCSLSILFALCLSPMAVQAQDTPMTFELPGANSGLTYRTEIVEELRRRYRLRLDAASQNPSLQWTVAAGELPPGLALRTDGTILGTPQVQSDQLFRLRFSVIDASSHSEGLSLEFTLNVKAPGLRLTRINDVKLVPVKESLAQGDAFISASSSRVNNEVSIPATDAGDVVAPGISTGSLPQGRERLIRWTESQRNYTEGQKSFAITVNPSSKICLLNTLVFKKNQLGEISQVVDHQPKKVDYNAEVQSFLVKLAPGENHIAVTAYAKKNDKQSCEPDADPNTLSELDSLTSSITCEGNNCGKAPKPDESASPLSNKNMRVVLGIEQSGASSAANAQNPFVDFFFSTGLTKKRWVSWGNIRLGTTPQQITAFASSATNAVGAATSDKINDLATSFDFRVGPEFQLNPDANTRVSLIAGFGATSSLTGPPKSSAIFKLPSNSSVQYANFIEQYPEAQTTGATHITFVPHEQDRFFRQYFMGLRIKSYHGDQFPSMFDVTFGQNSAVTGGKLRHFVLGFDGSRQLPIRGGAVYIFGSANLKVGGPKFRSTPFVLDPAEASVKMSDPTVLITSRQSNRDFYRIGFGIDLVGLFKEKKKTE